MKIPFVDLGAQYRKHQAEIDQAIQRVLDHNSFILGEEVRQFECEFANYVSARATVGVSSGTAALRLALQACDIGPGDEVITTAHTFIATAEAISHLGARPVFVDIDPRTYTLDPNCVEAAITRNTRVILPVHLYGQPADLKPLVELASRHNLWLIEDAAQAHGAEYVGQRCGSIGHLTCYSFYPGKNLGAYGDAGAVTGNDEQLLERVRRLRDHGRTSKYLHMEIGYCDRMDAIQAAVLRAKLPHLDAWNAARRQRAQWYRQGLEGLAITLPYEHIHARHVYHLFVIRTPGRDALQADLESHQVVTRIHYPVPLHRQPAYARLGYENVQLPETEKAAIEVLSLPMYPELNEDQITYIVERIRTFLAKKA